jgi:threonine/homoserine/homoserine lactone efflux protein
MLLSIPFLISGIIFGLLAGVSPGPMLTIVISETLKHNKKEGIKIAVTPLFTDIPIILILVFLLSKLSFFNSLVSYISFLGAMFLIYMAYECIVFKGTSVISDNIKTHSFKKGIITNFLNPYPYIFWFTIGAPMLIKAYACSTLSVIIFVSGLYVCLVGSKIIIVLIVDKSKSFINSNVYKYIIRLLGIVLVVFAIIFIIEGLKLA